MPDLHSSDNAVQSTTSASPKTPKRSLSGSKTRKQRNQPATTSPTQKEKVRARSCLERSLSAMPDLHSSDRTLQSGNLNLGIVLTDSDNSCEKIVKRVKKQSIRATVDPDRQIEIANDYLVTGKQAVEDGNLDTAHDSLLQALAILESILGNDHDLVAQTYYWVGIIEQKRSRHQIAAEAFVKSLRIGLRLELSSCQESKAALSQSLYAQGKQPQEIEYFLHSFKEALLLERKGDLYLQRKKYPEAISFYLSSIQTFDDSHHGSILENIALCYYQSTPSKLDQAVLWYRKALKAFSTSLGISKQNDWSRALNRLAIVLADYESISFSKINRYKSVVLRSVLHEHIAMELVKRNSNIFEARAELQLCLALEEPILGSHHLVITTLWEEISNVDVIIGKNDTDSTHSSEDVNILKDEVQDLLHELEDAKEKQKQMKKQVQLAAAGARKWRQKVEREGLSTGDEQDGSVAQKEEKTEEETNDEASAADAWARHSKACQTLTQKTIIPVTKFQKSEESREGIKLKKVDILTKKIANLSQELSREIKVDQDVCTYVSTQLSDSAFPKPAELIQDSNAEELSRQIKGVQHAQTVTQAYIPGGATKTFGDTLFVKSKSQEFNRKAEVAQSGQESAHVHLAGNLQKDAYAAQKTEAQHPSREIEVNRNGQTIILAQLPGNEAKGLSNADYHQPTKGQGRAAVVKKTFDQSFVLLEAYQVRMRAMKTERERSLENLQTKLKWHTKITAQMKKQAKTAAETWQSNEDESFKTDTGELKAKQRQTEIKQIERGVTEINFVVEKNKTFRDRHKRELDTMKQKIESCLVALRLELATQFESEKTTLENSNLVEKEYTRRELEEQMAQARVEWSTAESLTNKLAAKEKILLTVLKEAFAASDLHERQSEELLVLTADALNTSEVSKRIIAKMKSECSGPKTEVVAWLQELLAKEKKRQEIESITAAFSSEMQKEFDQFTVEDSKREMKMQLLNLKLKSSFGTVDERLDNMKDSISAFDNELHRSLQRLQAAAQANKWTASGAPHAFEYKTVPDEIANIDNKETNVQPNCSADEVYKWLSGMREKAKTEREIHFISTGRSTDLELSSTTEIPRPSTGIHFIENEMKVVREASYVALEKTKRSMLAFGKELKRTFRVLKVGATVVSLLLHNHGRNAPATARVIGNVSQQDPSTSSRDDEPEKDTKVKADEGKKKSRKVEESPPNDDGITNSKEAFVHQRAAQKITIPMKKAKRLEEKVVVKVKAVETHQKTPETDDIPAPSPPKKPREESFVGLSQSTETKKGSDVVVNEVEVSFVFAFSLI